MHLGNHVAGVYNIVVGIYCELGLRVNGQRLSSRNHGTYIEDVKDPVQVQLPGGDCLFVVLRMEKSRDRIPLALFFRLSLNLSHSPVTGSSLAGDPKFTTLVQLTGSTDLSHHIQTG